MKKLIILGLAAVAAVAAYRLIKNIHIAVEDTSEDEEATGPYPESGPDGTADSGGRVRPTVGVDVLKRIDELFQNPEQFVSRFRPPKGDVK